MSLFLEYYSIFRKTYINTRCIIVALVELRMKFMCVLRGKESFVQNGQIALIIRTTAGLDVWGERTNQNKGQ